MTLKTIHIQVDVVIDEKTAGSFTLSEPRTRIIANQVEDAIRSIPGHVKDWTTVEARPATYDSSPA